jgi:uncharacterized protein YqgC (DUF456 family)
MKKHELTLSQYILKRNGLPAGARGSLQNMLYRSFGASTFAGFWRYWNPIFGYGLGKYIYSPLRKIIPDALAFILTFIFCGALHDAISTAIRGSLACFFTPWFFFLGTCALLSEKFNFNTSKMTWMSRALVNALYISVSFVASQLSIRFLT